MPKEFKVPTLQKEVDAFDINLTPGKATEYQLMDVDRLQEVKNNYLMKIAGRPQPFKEYSKSDMDSLIQSVKEHGILTPLLVQQKDEQYIVLAGRHRLRAVKAIGLKRVPCIVRRDLNNTEAASIMLETNLKQRAGLTYSEKAWAFRMIMELQGRRGYRSDLDDQTKCNDCTKLDNLALIGSDRKLSRRTVAYLIRLTYLLPNLLEFVDSKKIPFKVGVKLSYLSGQIQAYILDTILPKYGKIGLNQATALQNLKDPSRDQVDMIFEIQRSAKSSVSLTFNIKDVEAVLGYPPDKKEVNRLWKEFLETLKPA